jgi:hypothetical protein
MIKRLRRWWRNRRTTPPSFIALGDGQDGQVLGVQHREAKALAPAWLPDD